MESPARQAVADRTPDNAPSSLKKWMMLALALTAVPSALFEFWIRLEIAQGREFPDLLFAIGFLAPIALIVYIVDAINNPLVEQRKKAWWVVLMLLFPLIVWLWYWQRYINNAGKNVSTTDFM